MDSSEVSSNDIRAQATKHLQELNEHVAFLYAHHRICGKRLWLYIQPKPTKFDFDLIVIGSGAGGGVSAFLLLATVKVGLVEADRSFGGDCPNYSCIPLKAYWSHNALDAMKSASKHGCVLRTLVTAQVRLPPGVIRLLPKLTAAKTPKPFTADGIKGH